MPFCPNCGSHVDAEQKFCGSCGTAVTATAAPAAPVAPVYEAPVKPAYEAPVTPAYQAPTAPVYQAPAPTYQAPTYPTYQPVRKEETNEISGGAKAKGIVGMVLGIVGMVFGALAGLFALVSVEEVEMVFYTLYFSIIALPLSIVGRVLAGKSQDAGNTAKGCSTGRALGLVGIIVSAVAFFIAIICLATY